MAREIELKIWCDPCMEIDGERVEGKEMPPVTIGNAKPRVIAMCQTHEEDFFKPFVEALTDMGTTSDALESPGRVRASSKHPRKLPSEGKGLQCPVEDCTQKGLASYRSVSSHLRNVHETNIFEVIGKDGQLFHDDGTPLTPMPEVRAVPRAESDAPDPARAECDYPGCGAVYQWPKNRKPAQALGVHKAKTHGIAGVGKNGNKAAKKVAEKVPA